MIQSELVEMLPASSWNITTSIAIANMFSSERANSPFHANPIIWSTRSLGQVARIHSSTNTTTNVLTINQICPGMGEKPFVPPRNRVTIIIAFMIGAMNSARNSSANLMPLYSVL